MGWGGGSRFGGGSCSLVWFLSGSPEGDQKRSRSRGDPEPAASHRVSEAPVSPGRAVVVLVPPVWSEEGTLQQPLKVTPFQSHLKHAGDSQAWARADSRVWPLSQRAVPSLPTRAGRRWRPQRRCEIPNLPKGAQIVPRSPNVKRKQNPLLQTFGQTRVTPLQAEV